MMRLIHGAASDVGLVRRRNEDSYVALPGLYAVCDGMGGARAGEVASGEACRVLREMSGDADADDLREAVDTANTIIRTRSLAESALAGMGTTMTAAAGSGDVLTIAQVGDSRAYLLRQGELRQVTDDHSLVAEMIRRGQLTVEQAAVHPHRSIITRALGTEESVRPDIFELPLAEGDRVVLCSDGLSGMVPIDEMQDLLAAAADPQSAADDLVAAALRHGGEDNVTVVAIFAIDEVEAAHADADQDPTQAGDAQPASPSAAATQEAGAGALAAPSPPTASEAPPTRRRSRLRVKVALAIAAPIIALGLAAGGFLLFNSTVYFVGTTTDGQITLFKGVPYRVLGVEMYDVVEVAPVSFEEIEPYLQERVDSHELVTKEEGLRFIRGLQTTP